MSFATEVHTENMTCLCCRQCHCSSIATAITPKQVLENGVLMGFWPETSSGSVWKLVPRKFVEYLEAILGLTVQLAAKWCYCEIQVESSKLMETSVFFFSLQWWSLCMPFFSLIIGKLIAMCLTVRGQSLARIALLSSGLIAAPQTRSNTTHTQWTL